MQVVTFVRMCIFEYMHLKYIQKNSYFLSRVRNAKQNCFFNFDVTVPHR